MLPQDIRRKRSWRILVRRPIKWIFHHPKVSSLFLLLLITIGFGFTWINRPVTLPVPELWETSHRYMRELPFTLLGDARRYDILKTDLRHRVHTSSGELEAGERKLVTSQSFAEYTPDMPQILWDIDRVPRTPLSRFNDTIQSRIQYIENTVEKRLAYGTNELLYSKYPVGSKLWLNTFSTFPNVTPLQMHGKLGVNQHGIPIYAPKQMPPAINKYPLGYEAALKHGGFYHNLSEALPLDRAVPDHRESICQRQTFNLSELPDASIVITYFNEPFSTLMRTVHSVLNQTPPELLREIILVDDHSDYLWATAGLDAQKQVVAGSDTARDSHLYNAIIEEYIRYLPKVKLLRLPERRGLVHARLAGARAAGGEVLVVLDSHVEVNPGWLEPQLARIKESPNSIVFPQILSINPENFKYDTESGIGCRLGFKWSMIEQSTMASKVTDVGPVASGSMAGGLFAVNLDYFWHIGGYDEGFRMWGSENVEMGFRTWMCGGRLECMPCSKTFHIYRKKGGGYASPSIDILRNKLRTARLWTDEYFTLATTFIAASSDVDIGNLDKMIELKKRLQCKPFQWYLDNIPMTSNSKFVKLKPGDVRRLGELKVISGRPWCMDTMQRVEAGQSAGVFPCHGEGGTQAWLYISSKDWTHIIPTSNERFCLSVDGKYSNCEESDKQQQWEVRSVPSVNGVKLYSLYADKCLSYTDSKLLMTDCENPNAFWSWPEYKPPNFEPLDFSADYADQLNSYGHPHLIPSD